MREAAFKYTVPIQKAEEREDGALVLVGLASGPEIDGDGDRVTPEAIWGFARQINEQDGIPLTQRVPYVDAHAKDGVMRELGWVSKAWVTDSGHLGVEVELDRESPAAVFLHKQVMRGKQFGMSVAGKVIDWAFEYAPEIGKSVRTFRNVILSEISNTTKPSWSHSLGTVIAKAIQDAEDSESDAAVGENVDNDELQTEQETTETPAVDENPEVVAEEAVTEETTEEAVEEAPAADAVEEAAETPAEEVAEETEAEAEETEATEEEPAAEDDVVARMLQMFTDFRDNMTEMLTKYGVEPVLVAKSVSSDENEPTFEKALQEATAPLQVQIEELQKSLTEATARIEELENSPAGDDAPGLAASHVSEPDIEKALSAMTPSERLRAGLRARYNG